MDKLAAKPGVDPESKAREMNLYQLSDENIADQQWFTFLAGYYQDILKTAAETLRNKPTSTMIREYAELFNPDQHYSEQQLALQIVNSKGMLRTLNDKLSKLETELNKLKLRPQQIRQETLSAEKRLKQAKVDI
ncbi:hypothetical protein [Bathymodiolus japonicus methanotrophic gill symbiont]|uniref:hypothetical protein n=1 Tax=Bathymodiolus japonicus methanotrophic gill symbiont TaxID=113269 RepID=UPI001C8EA4B5|nr:hypothetical protein [Bathymodiolus japonicus methanotrophic gill symbiont]